MNRSRACGRSEKSMMAGPDAVILYVIRLTLLTNLNRKVSHQPFRLVAATLVVGIFSAFGYYLWLLNVEATSSTLFSNRIYGLPAYLCAAMTSTLMSMFIYRLRAKLGIASIAFVWLLFFFASTLIWGAIMIGFAKPLKELFA